MSVNKVTLLGHTGKAPDFKEFDNGGVATFSLATTKRAFTTKDGRQIPERTEWHNIVLQNGLAKVANQYVKKGDKLYIEGELRTRSYDDAQGVKRYVTEIHADRIEFYSTGSRPADGGNTTAQGGSMQPNVGQGQSAQPTTAPNTAYQQPAASQPSAFSESSDADDLPF